MESVTSPSAVPTSTLTGGATIESESDNAAAPSNINLNSNANNDERVVAVNNQESVHSLPPPVVNEDNKEKLFIHETAAAPSSSTDTDGDSREMNDTQTQQQQQQIPITKSSNHSSLLTSNNNNAPTTSSSHTSLNEAKIDKATSFLRNTELNNVSTFEKRNYLKEKVGMTFDEINVAFDRVANADADGLSGRDRDYNDGQRGNMNSMGSTSNSRDERNAGQLRERQGYNRSTSGRFDDGNDGRQRVDGYRDQYHNQQQQQQQDDDGYNHRGQERGQPPSQYNTSYNNDSNYNTNMSRGGGGGRYPIMAAHDQAPPPPPQSSIVPTGGGWMGGFSLGIFCLAALRWLNGGDFILFPPPSKTTAVSLSASSRAIENVRLQKQEEDGAVLDNGEDGATDTSDSHHHEEEEENELQEEEEVDNVDYQEEVEEEYEEETDDGINMILNGTSSNAQHFQKQQQPSHYDELALEIRALTTAKHTYRDVQERSHRAVTAHVGKGMTDDAMDFLRQSKKKSEVEDGGGKSVEGVCLKEGHVVMIAKKLLEDVSDDLSKLKESLAVQFEDKRGNGDSEIQGDDSDESKDTDSNEKELNSEQQEPLKQIDKVMEKVQQMMAVMEKNTVKPKEEESVTTSNEDELKEGDSTVETTENKRTSVDSTTTVPMASATGDKQRDEKTTPSTSESSLQEQSSNSEEATTQQATTSPPQATTAATMEQLEEALKRLANNNNNSNPNNLKVGAQMLYLYCLNISKNPSVPRYRKIYTNNNTFRNKVGTLDGAKELLLAVGFVERASFFEWGAAASSEEESSSKPKLDFALVALEMMKNGSITTDKPSNGDGAEDNVTGDAALPTLVEEGVPLESKEITQKQQYQRQFQ